MPSLSLLSRNQRSGILLNVTEHSMQMARLSRLDEKPLVIDSFVELPPGDDEAIGQWVRASFPERGQGFLPGYCGFHPHERVLLRENINPRRMAEPSYLPTLLAEQAKLPSVNDWQICALHPLEGELFTPATPARPGLLLGLPLSGVRDLQQRLRKVGIRPRRLEIGSVALLGGLMRYLRETAYPHAAVVCEIGQTQTRIYFVAKDGVHTPATLPHGLLSIHEAAMKELAVPDIASARLQLADPTPELRTHSRRHGTSSRRSTISKCRPVSPLALSFAHTSRPTFPGWRRRFAPRLTWSFSCRIFRPGCPRSGCNWPRTPRRRPEPGFRP